MAVEAKLRWRCRRGMKELDVLLLNYLERHYPTASAEQRQAFGELLELPDPLLWDWLIRRAQPAEPIQLELIERIVAS